MLNQELGLLAMVQIAPLTVCIVHGNGMQISVEEDRTLLGLTKFIKENAKVSARSVIRLSNRVED